MHYSSVPSADREPALEAVSHALGVVGHRRDSCGACKRELRDVLAPGRAAAQRGDGNRIDAQSDQGMRVAGGVRAAVGERAASPYLGTRGSRSYLALARDPL